MAESLMNKSARRNLIAAFKDAAKTVRNGRYRVKRGFVNYVTFPYDKNPFVLAIQIPQEPFKATVVQDEASGTTSAEMALEFSCLLPEGDTDPEINEDVLDEFVEDAREIVRQVLKRKDVANDDVAVNVVGREAEPFMSLDLGIQGLTVGLRVDW